MPRGKSTRQKKMPPPLERVEVDHPSDAEDEEEEVETPKPKKRGRQDNKQKKAVARRVVTRSLRTFAHLAFAFVLAFFLSTPSESCLLLRLQYCFVYMS